MILGVDPGVAGALASLNEGDGWLLGAVEMPTITVKVGAKNRSRIDGAGLASLMRRMQPSHVVMEKVRPRKGDTPMTAGYLLHAAGMVEGVVIALGIPLTMVEPMVWRRGAGVSLPAGSTYLERKEASRQRALQLWPNKADLFARKKDCDRAEAALIGRWGLTAAGVLAGAA